MNKFRQRLFNNQLTYPKNFSQKDCLPLVKFKISSNLPFTFASEF